MSGPACPARPGAPSASKTLRLPLRASRLWQPGLVAAGVCTALALAGLVLRAIAAPLRPFEAALLPAGGLGLLASLAVAWRVGGRAGFVELSGEGLRIPRQPGAAVLRRVAYRRILGLDRVAPAAPSRTLIAVAGALPAVVRDRDWCDPRDRERFARALTARVRAVQEPPARDAFVERTRTAEAWRGRPTPLVLALAALLCGVFALEIVMPREIARAGMALGGGLHPAAWHRLITPALLHATLWHLGLDLAGLLLLGIPLEQGLRSGRLAVVIAGSAVAGNAVSMAWRDHGASVGASTVVYGLLGAVLWLNLVRRRELRPALLATPGVALLALAPALPLELMPRIDSAGHLGGLLGGLLATAAVTARTPLAALPRHTPRPVRALAGALLAVAALAVARAVALGLGAA